MLTATTTTTTFTSTGLQTVSFSGVTWTPKAVKVEVFWVTASDTLQDHYSYGRGYSDGTNDASMSWAAEDNLDFSACHRANSTVVARLIDPVNHNNEFVMTGSTGGAGAVSGGWQFNVTTADAAARVMRVTIYGGTDCNAAVRRFLAGATWSIADTSFQPNLAEFATVSTTFDDGVATFHVPAVGWACDNGAGTDQIAVARSNANNSDVTSIVALYDQGVCCGQQAAPWTWNISVDSWNANGVSGTGTGSGYDDVACLLLDTGDSAAWVGLVTCPTSTGDTSFTDPGFTPQLIEGCATDLEHPLFDGAHYFDAIGSFGWFNATSTEQTCGNPISEDNADITNEATFFSTSALEVHGHDQASTLYEASLTSFDATGWTWNFSTAGATTYAIIVAAIEAESSGSAEGDGAIVSVATMAGDGLALVASDGSFSSVLSVAGVGAATADADASTTATVELSGAASALRIGQGDVDGVASLAAVGSSVAESSGDAAAVAEVAAVGAAVFAGAGSIPAVSLLTADGTAVAVSAATLAAVATLAGVSATSSAGAITAESAVTGAVSATTTGDGALQSGAVLTGVMAATTAADGAVSSTAALEAEGTGSVDATGEIVAEAAVSGDGTTADGSSGAIASSSTLSGLGASTGEATASAAMQAILAGSGGALLLAEATLAAVASLAAGGTGVTSSDGAVGATAAMSADGTALLISAGSLEASISVGADGQSISVTSGIAAAQAQLAGEALSIAFADGTIAAAAQLAGLSLVIIADTEPVVFIDLSTNPIMAFDSFEVAPVIEFRDLELS